MIDLARITGFQWDTGSARKNDDRYGVTQADAEQVFFNEPLLLAFDHKHSDEEVRYRALGQTDDGRRLHITFTLRDETLVRVISARDMSRRERRYYEDG